MQLQECAAFVTGGAQGLGKAFIEALLSQGASVCFCDLQELKGKEIEEELQCKYGKNKVMFRPCDVASEEAFSKVFDEAVEKFGRLDLMVNNAGIGDESRTRAVIDINLYAVIKGSQFAIEHMRKDKGGKGGVIINISSAAGLRPVYLFPVYTASKYGVLGYTESWASNPHIGDIDIKFACLCPSFADTAIIDVCADKCLFRDDIRGFFDLIGIIPVEEVTKAFMQLVESDNCNGDVLAVDRDEGIHYIRKNGQPVASATPAKGQS